MKMSDLPIEFKSNFAERNNYKVLHQSNLSQVEKLTSFNTFHTQQTSNHLSSCQQYSSRFRNNSEHVEKVV